MGHVILCLKNFSAMSSFNQEINMTVNFTDVKCRQYL